MSIQALINTQWQLVCTLIALEFLKQLSENILQSPYLQTAKMQLYQHLTTLFLKQDMVGADYNGGASKNQKEFKDHLVMAV